MRPVSDDGTLIDDVVLPQLDLVPERVDLSDYPLDPTAAALVPERMCSRHRLLPIGFEGETLVVAMSDPNNVLAVDDVRTITGLAVKTVSATEQEILEASRRLARTEDSWSNLVAEAEQNEEHWQAPSVLLEAADEGPIIKLVNLLIGRAVTSRASDVHIEPEKRHMRVRYRIDGVLHEVMTLPKSVQPGVVSRLKLMADMDIAERRVPQDGRTELTVMGESVDLRAATLPTMFGEKVVIRILRKSNVLMDLRDLGFSDYNFARFEASLRRPHGMILVTGPTGSGKTTSLYAALHALNDVAKNIITVEDPVEYHLPGAYQVQVNPKAGLTFAAALRSILRSDPDTLLVGEIRDHETAHLAIDAALTGHLVFSSLHTNDAASAVARLTEMGIEPYLVASAVSCVIAQRLVRVLCERCKEPYRVEDDIADQVGIARGTTLARPVGCPHCSDTGYHGRNAVHEVMLVDEDIERLTADRAHADRIGLVARAHGMKTMFEDARQKVVALVTSVEEIARAVGTEPVRSGTPRVEEDLVPPAFDPSKRVPLAVPVGPVAPVGAPDKLAALQAALQGAITGIARQL
ncbi:MAG: GspE/PulE family protein [Actinomycetota bacterium]